MNIRFLSRGLLISALLALPEVRPAHAISSEPVPLPALGERSPNGRWIARVEEPKGQDKRARIVFTDTRTRRSWALPLRARSRDGYPSYSSAASVTWRSDGRAAAIHAGDGWRIAYPHRRWAKRIAGGGEANYASWAPRSGRLALFESWGGSLYIWKGGLSSRKTWVPSDYPEPGDAHVWQAEWSPDESAILLRFYGHAERDSDNAGHTFVISPRTGRALYGWGAEARPTAWLDSRRVIFLGDKNDGLMGPDDLVVARPSSKSQAQRRQIWLSDVVAWTLSPRRDSIWALKSNGDLMRSPARFKSWKKVRSLANSIPGRYAWDLQTSPGGDVLAITQAYNGHDHSVSIVSTGPRPWMAIWSTPTSSTGTIRVLGWEPGRSLPQVEWSQGYNKPRRIIQLKW